jgi:TolA-binding protein
MHKLAWSQFQLGSFAAAREAFRRQRETFPEGALAADARVMVAEALFKEKRYAEALAAFDEARAGKATGKALAVVATLHAAQAASQLEKWEPSMALLQECAERFPESEYQDEVDFEIGWVQQHVGKHDEALRRYERVAERNELELGARAQFMIGEIQFEQKKYDDAVRSFFKVAYGYGDKQAPDAIRPWQANATFEAARCLELLENTSAAKRLYEELVERFPHTDRAPLAKEKIESLGERTEP